MQHDPAPVLPDMTTPANASPRRAVLVVNTKSRKGRHLFKAAKQLLRERVGHLSDDALRAAQDASVRRHACPRYWRDSAVQVSHHVAEP